jgi:hypothetical protein
MKTATTKSYFRNIFFFVIISLFLNQYLFSQSLGKTYNFIDKGKLDKAVAEVKSFTPEIKRSPVDFTLYGIASCLITINSEYQDYDPYKSLEMYQISMKIGAEKSEVDKFLAKYDLSISRVHELILQNILKESKAINTEEAYVKALSVCDDCFYQDEVEKLKEKAAYNEAIDSYSISACKYFLNTYPESVYRPEIMKNLENLAFEKATNEGTLEGMEAYIDEFNNKENIFLKKAYHMRDSMAFSMVNKSYREYREYSMKYPESEYIYQVEKELPDLLYNEGTKSRDIELLELFVNEYPSDSRVENTQDLLEKLYYENLQNNFSIAEFNRFKLKFPDSSYIGPLSEVYSNIMQNNDLKKAGLKGPVRSVKTYYKDSRHGDSQMLVKYNDLGNLISHEGSLTDEIEGFLYDLTRQEIQDESRVHFVYGYISLDVTMERAYSGGDITNFEYNNRGQLVRATGSYIFDFFYDADGNLVKKDIKSAGRAWERDVLLYRILYKWDNGRLLYKHVYTADGQKYRYYDIEYDQSNTGYLQTINESYSNWNYRITVSYNEKNQIEKKVDEARYDDYYKVWFEHKIRNYSYENGHLISISTIDKSLEKQYNSFTGEFKVVPNRYRGDYTVRIERNSYGDVTSTSGIKGKEWDYKYDYYGNWIEKTEYSVVKGDITIRNPQKVVCRNITYY